jgi:hypothetical protein
MDLVDATHTGVQGAAHDGVLAGGFGGCEGVVGLAAQGLEEGPEGVRMAIRGAARVDGHVGHILHIPIKFCYGAMAKH